MKRSHACDSGSIPSLPNPFPQRSSNDRDNKTQLSKVERNDPSGKDPDGSRLDLVPSSKSVCVDWQDVDSHPTKRPKGLNKAFS